MKKRFAIISVLALLAAFAACNKEATGEQEVAELKSLVLDSKGKVVFDASTVSGLYTVGVESQADAKELAGIYVGSNFNATASSHTRTLSGNKGTVKATKGTNGVFWSLRFNVEGIPTFTLDIIDANGNNGPTSYGEPGTYHKCPICKRTWRSASDLCPWGALHNTNNSAAK